MAEEILARLQTFTNGVMERVEEDLKADGFYPSGSGHSTGGHSAYGTNVHSGVEDYHPDPERLFEYNYIIGFDRFFL